MSSTFFLAISRFCQLMIATTNILSFGAKNASLSGKNPHQKLDGLLSGQELKEASEKPFEIISRGLRSVRSALNLADRGGKG